MLVEPSKLVQTRPKRSASTDAMARKKSKQQAAVQKELVLGQQSAATSPVSPGGDAAGGGDAELDRLASTRANQVATTKPGWNGTVCSTFGRQSFILHHQNKKRRCNDQMFA